MRESESQPGSGEKPENSAYSEQVKMLSEELRKLRSELAIAQDAEWADRKADASDYVARTISDTNSVSHRSSVDIQRDIDNIELDILLAGMPDPDSSQGTELP